MAEDFSKSRAPPPAGPRGYEPPPAGWRPGKPSSPLTGERPDSRGQAPPAPRAYPPPGAAGLSFAHALPPGLPLSHLMQHWVPPGPAASRAGLYQLPGTRAGAEELLHQQLEREQRLIAQHRQQQQQQQQPSLASREAAEKQQREAEKQQREAEKQQREAAERLRQEEERKKQQQAVSQHFEESMRLMQQKGRLGSAPAGSSAGGGLPGLSAPPPGGRFGDRRPADGSSDPERMIHARIHRLYQSTEPAGQPGKPPEPPRPGYPAQPLPPEYLSPYYDPLKAQMHAAKPPADRHSPYLPTAPPGQPSYKPALPRPTQGRSPVPAEARLPPPPRPMSGHGGERSCSPYLPPAPAPPPPPHRAVYSPNAALAGAGSRPPPPAHGGRRPATPPSQLHQTLDLSVGSRSSAAIQGRESPKRPASTPGLNLGMSPAKRARPEEEEQQHLQQQQQQQLQQQQQQLQQQQQQQQQQRLQQPAPVVVASRAADEPLSLVATPASRRSASPAPPPAAVLSAPAPALSASAPASGTASPAPADVPAPAPVVKTEPVDTRPATYTHKLKKKWLQRHAGGDTTERPSSSVNGADVPAPPPADLPNGSGARPIVKVSPPTSVKSEPAETPEPAASPTPAAPQGTRSTPPSPPPSLPETKPQPLPTVTVNGGDGDSDDSGNSTPPAKRRPAPRRKPPKKAALEMAPAAVTPPRDAKRQKVSDASDSDSDKGSDDDDTPTRDVRKQDSKSAKKRGRRTKEKPAKTPKRSAAKPEKKEPSPPKKVVESFKRPSISKLKKSGASFVQNQSCCDLSSKLPKCRECRITQGQKNKKLSSCCRFTSFRRLRYTKSGVLTVAGFCDPEQDAEAEDRRLWLPAERGQTPPPPMPAEVARLLLSHASGAFTELVGAEQEAARAHLNTDKTVAWKRVVHGYGEMCDVCETTLFNVHWVCSKCGFAVCADCYRGRAAEGGAPRGGIEPGRDRDRFQWMLCSSRQPHEPQRLMLTQIVTGDALTQLSARVQEARRRAGLAPLGRTAGALANGAHGARHGGDAGGDQEDKRGSPLTLLANVALYDSRKNSDASNSESESEGGDKEVDLSTLRTLLLRTSEAGGQLQEKPNSKDRSRTPADAALAALDENLEKTAAGQPESPADEPTLRHFVRRDATTRARVPRLAPRVLTSGESQRRYPDVRHGWLCDGRLLRLAEPDAAGALRLFGDQWRRGQPVLCSGVGERLDAALWTPEAFARDFGEEQTETVDCVSGAPLPAQPQRRFWDGFGDFSQRQRDASGQKRVLRLRDWPPGDEFADLLPTRYNDLLTALPVTAYTRRDGRYNLATWLPECFVRPELGPRLHAVYGGASASAAAAAGGGLRQDVADAVHVLAHVAHGAATGPDDDSDIQQALEDAGCDALTKRRARDERAGVIWHIFHADDADKIRDLLNKVSSERGAEVETDHDPLLSADRYMDAPLRRRLLSEYGVSGYAVLQCQGDAVFVPAGAPYQRRQLRAGISAAVEFVSPENVGISFELTQQQRAAAVSSTASPTASGATAASAAAGATVDGRPSVVVQDDKRQIKNIIYHAMKEAVSKLLQPAGSGDSSPPVGAS